jgi:O-antigen/teichoic acid export membrane protein
VSASGAPRPAGEGDTISRNTASALLAQATTAICTAGLTLYLVRALSPDDYGLFALALATGLLALQPSDFGISQSMARFMAEHRDDPVAVREVFSSALRLKLISGVVVGIALYALAEPIANAYGEPDLLWPLRVISVAVLAQGMMNFFVTPFMALRRVALRARVVVFESILEVASSLALVALGGGVTGALFGRTIGYAFGAALALVIVARLLGWHARRSLRSDGGGHLRRIAGYASAMLIVEGAFTAFTQVDVIVIGAYLSSADVAFFQAPSRLTTLLAYPGLALSAGVAPRLSFGGDGPDVASLERSLRYLLIFQAALIPPIVVWAGPLTSLLLGDDYTESADVLRALAPYVFASGFAPLLSVGVNYLGEARRRVPIAIATVLVNLVIDLILVPKIGIVGAAIGTDVAFCLYVGAHLWVFKRILPLRLAHLGPTVLRATAAGLAMAGVLLALGTSDLTVAAWIAGAIAAPLAFLAVILGLGEFSRAELSRARAAVASRVRPAA